MTAPTFAPAPPAPPPVRLVPAKPTPTGRAALAKPESEGGGNRMLTYLRLHWLTILFLGGLIGAGLAYAAWTLVPPNYESYALFQVASAPSQVSATGDPTRGRTEFNTYLKTTASLFKTELVYTRALADLRDNPTLAAQKDPVKFLDRELVVDTKEGSEIIRLSMKGVNPDDVKAIVDAVKRSYIEQIVEREWGLKHAQKKDLEAQVARLGQQVKQKTGPGGGGGVGASGLSDKPGAAPPTVMAQSGVGLSAEPDHVKQAMLPKLIDQAARLRELPAGCDAETEQLLAGIAAAKAAVQKRLEEPVSTEATELAKKDEAYLKAKYAADQKQGEYTRRSASAANPNSPTMTALKLAADSAQEEADAILATKAKALESDRRKQLTVKLEQDVAVAELKIQQLAKTKQRALEELPKLQQALNSIPPPQTTPQGTPLLPKGPIADPVVTDILTTNQILEKATAHLLALEMELTGQQKRVTVLQSASVPQVTDAKKQILATAVAGLMGFAVVAGCVLLAETRARKVSSLGELKGVSQTPVVGVVPWMPDGATARDPLKRADVNEAIDKLRAYVVQAWLSRGASTVTVTSALGDEGKAFTAFGLASSLAQAGYKTLLADFDLRSPSLHPFAGVPNAAGVCELLRGEADFRKTIQILPNGLHFLAAGKWSDDARQAAVGGRLEALLNRLKEPFDCVVLHGHALLTVAESVEVARRSEVVLLCALYRDTRCPMLKRAADRVAGMEIPFAGIVYLGATPNEALC